MENTHHDMLLVTTAAWQLSISCNDELMVTFFLNFELRRRGGKDKSHNGRVLLLYYQAINSGSICYNEKSICNDMSQEFCCHRHKNTEQCPLCCCCTPKPPGNHPVGSSGKLIFTVRSVMNLAASSTVINVDGSQRRNLWHEPWVILIGSWRDPLPNECVYEIIPRQKTWVVECPKNTANSHGLVATPICIYLLSI